MEWVGGVGCLTGVNGGLVCSVSQSKYDPETTVGPRTLCHSLWQVKEQIEGKNLFTFIPIWLSCYIQGMGHFLILQPDGLEIYKQNGHSSEMVWEALVESLDSQNVFHVKITLGSF